MNDRERLIEIADAWEAYVDFLRKQYPRDCLDDGTFLFKCLHHHRINELLNELPECLEAEND